MSKYKIVPVEPTDEMCKSGVGDLSATEFGVRNAYLRMLAVAPAPVARAEDIERVAEALWLAQTLRLLRDAPEQARLEYAELDDATKGHLRWDARAALRAMGYEVADGL